MNSIDKQKLLNLERNLIYKKKLLEEKANIISQERNNNIKKELLKKERMKTNIQNILPIEKKSYIPLNNNLTGGINESIVEKIKNFFKSQFFKFMKDYLIFLILFSICFYILLYINNSSNSSLIITETKVFVYLLVIFLFIIVNDIMATPQEDLIKFIFILLFSLLIVYISGYLINKYYGNESFNSRLIKLLGICIFVFIVVCIIIYFNFQKKKPEISNLLYKNFNIAFGKNYIFLIYFTFYLFFYKMIEYIGNWNNALTDIICPTILGGFLLFFIFCILIFLAYKMKVINNRQFLNAMLALFGIAVYLGFVHIYIFMNSLSTICNNNEELSVSENNTKELLINLMIVSLIIILWLDDTRNWHQIGSILFIIASCITFITMFYYSTIYPSISLLSFWLFIEWIIIIFKRKENSKNSLHYSFMKT
jgi:hypothetical protein